MMPRIVSIREIDMGNQESKQWRALARWGRLLALGLAVGWGAVGCTERTQSADDVEREHPMMKAAQEKERSGDEAAAISIYKSLTAQNPDMARPHLALAFLMDKPGRDPACAIYHYQRYLELRPDSEKGEMLGAYGRRKSAFRYPGRPGLRRLKPYRCWTASLRAPERTGSPVFLCRPPPPSRGAHRAAGWLRSG